MRLCLNMNKNFQICSGIKHLIDIWVRLLDLPSLKEMIGDYLCALRNQSPIPFPYSPRCQIQGLLSCTMNQTNPRGFSSDAWSVGLPLLCTLMIHIPLWSCLRGPQLQNSPALLLGCASKATDPLVGGPLFRCAAGSPSAPCSLLTSAIPLLISFSPEHRKACREAGIR